MVLIRRATVATAAGWAGPRWRRRCGRCVRGVLVTAVIPLVFVLRHFITVGRHQHDTTNHSHDDSSYGRLGAVWSSAGRLRIRGGTDATGSGLHSLLHSNDGRYQQHVEFLERVDYSVRHNLYDSDIVELHHCNVAAVNWTHFLAFADPLLEEAAESLRAPLAEALRARGLDDAAPVMATLETEMRQEFLLELLEQYAAAQHGLCDYSQYRPSVVGHATQGHQLLRRNSAAAYRVAFRLAIVISAFHDVDQLATLIEAVNQPQHYIVVHLERSGPAEFRNEVNEVAKKYNNVVILRFGTVVYRTDSVSMINLRILRWLTMDLKLAYNHALLLDGSAFPLQSPDHLVSALQSAGRSVWLGELTHKGQRATGHPANHLLWHKRLVFTRNNYDLKLHKRLPKQAWADAMQLSTAIRDHMIYKSTSGNQGIYSRAVVQQLLNSDTVMELFALSKYGCCCCLEERNWIAALSMIGHAQEALQYTSMFQVWGGDTVCGGSMNNAVLFVNATLCYRSEDPAHSSNNTDPEYFRGDGMWDYLVAAKRRGFFFARKFQSDSADSMAVLSEVRSKVWRTPG